MVLNGNIYLRNLKGRHREGGLHIKHLPTDTFKFNIERVFDWIMAGGM